MDFTIGHSDIVPTIGAKAASDRGLYDQFAQLTVLLANAGIPAKVLPYAVAQVMHETNGLSSNVSADDNNWSGIKYLHKSYQKATAGRPAPKSEGGGHYAHFATHQDWANDYARILRISGSKGAPLDAPNADQFLQRLYANHYFTANYASYAAGFNKWLKKYNQVVNDTIATGKQYASGEKTTATAGDWNAADDANVTMQKIEAFVHDHWKGLAAGLVILFVGARALK